MQIVAYGAGINSTAMLIEMVKRKEKCNFILFSDTGGERPKTYTYIKLFSEWLKENNYPEIIILKSNQRAPTLESKCLFYKTLPSIAYGYKSCSLTYKRSPQDIFINNNELAKSIWNDGEKIIKCLGFDIDEIRRAGYREDTKYIYRHPLIEWKMGREECLDSISKVGLPNPSKSACFFCPATTKPEILKLKEYHPDLLKRALTIEKIAMEKAITVKGLGRRFSWEEFIKTNTNTNIDNTLVEEPCECYDG